MIASVKACCRTCRPRISLPFRLRLTVLRTGRHVCSESHQPLIGRRQAELHTQPKMFEWSCSRTEIKCCMKAMPSSPPKRRTVWK